MILRSHFIKFRVICADLYAINNLQRMYSFVSQIITICLEICLERISTSLCLANMNADMNSIIVCFTLQVYLLLFHVVVFVLENFLGNICNK